MANHNDFEQTSVSSGERCGFWSMFMIMMGFTFFSASMWVGQKIGSGMTFGGFVSGMMAGNLVAGVRRGQDRAFNPSALAPKLRHVRFLHSLVGARLYSDRLVWRGRGDVLDSDYSISEGGSVAPGHLADVRSFGLGLWSCGFASALPLFAHWCLWPTDDLECLFWNPRAAHHLARRGTVDRGARTLERDCRHVLRW